MGSLLSRLLRGRMLTGSPSSQKLGRESPEDPWGAVGEEGLGKGSWMTWVAHGRQ